MIDYTVCYKRVLNLDDISKTIATDTFISAYNPSERVRAVFDRVSAKTKHWLVLPEYNLAPEDHPAGDLHAPPASSEAEWILGYCNGLGKDHLGGRICVDITGLIPPYMMFLLRTLLESGVQKLDILYTEPSRYRAKEETRFSDEAIIEVRQVAGFEGTHNPDTSSDLLIIGAGYDDKLIAQVAESKENAKKIRLIGWPSLRPDMYQENILRAHRAIEAMGINGSDSHDRFAPAHDPFVTAQVLAEIVSSIQEKRTITNLYLSPLSTKAQALGFTLFYLAERADSPTSIIYPICKRYESETADGIGRVWQYSLESLEQLRQ